MLFSSLSASRRARSKELDQAAGRSGLTNDGVWFEESFPALTFVFTFMQESAEKHVGEPLCQTNQGKMVRLRVIC
jgi:hypothetical protein